ncbi:MAG: TRAP transporter substrate-binding protein [Planctomycetaceae bacterium]|nr:TRAP transporter substrate-binding protein [Planctomycetaceae bacterium]
MKKLMSLLAAFILCAGLAQAANYRLSEVHAEGYPTALADREFARLVEERTNGRIKIEVYTGGTLYGEETGAIEALQVGDLAFTRVSASPVASYVPNINAVQMPYLYKSGEHMWDALNGPIGQGLLADIEKSGSGLVGLCYYDAGSRCFYTTKPVNKVADMRGLKIRMQNNAMMVRMVSLLGGTGVTGIGPNEVYSAIQTGTVDGAENNWPTYQNMGDYEVAKYYILDHHTRVPEILLMSKVVKDEMSAEDFAIIQQCAKDTQEFEIKAWADKEKSSEEIVRKAGTQVIELTPEAFAEFQKAMEPLYDEFGKDFMETIQAIQKVGEKY